MDNFSRRDFVKILGGAAVGSLALSKPSIAKADGLAPRFYSGADLTGWEAVIGDGLWVGPGQAPIDNNDIETVHTGPLSEVKANVQNRGVMTHNITYKRFIDNDAFDFIHTCTIKFRLPYLPSTAGGPENAQTVEGGFFIWDGGNTRLDYGFAFQWVLNPWVPSFGDVWMWVADASNGSGGYWAPSGYLQPDTNWHELKLVFDHQNQATGMFIDNVPYMSSYGGTPKPSSWGTETAARFQAEIISIWPGFNSWGPQHKAEFKDWSWDWTPYSSE